MNLVYLYAEVCSDLWFVQLRTKVKLKLIDFILGLTAVYSTIGPRHDVNVGVERELSSRHLLACLYAGVTIGGRDREDGPSQV